MMALITGHHRMVMLVLIVLGIGERVAWNLGRSWSGAQGEAMNVAAAIASGRGVADAYRIGQGATAHLLPVNHGIGGGVYAVFGLNTPLSEFILASWSIGLAMGTYLLLFRAFGRLGTPLPARLLALGFACLAPAYTGSEAVDFRIWEGGLAVFLSALFLDRLLAAREGATFSDLGFLAITGGVLFFVNPPMGLAAFAAAGLFALQHLAPSQIAAAVAMSVAAISLLVVPWALRNDRTLGEPVLLRSNAGLELAIANYPGALDPGDPKEKFLQRLNDIHPAKAGYAAMIANGGEIAYSRKLGAEATAWMKANPGQTARLMARHLRQSLLPDRWQFDVFNNKFPAAIRMALANFAGLFGLAGLLWACFRQRPAWIYPAIMIGVLALLTSPFQPVVRYTYLFYPMMVFCAFDFLAAVRRRDALNAS